jgi:AcrR family transcriptional regulator
MGARRLDGGRRSRYPLNQVIDGDAHEGEALARAGRPDRRGALVAAAFARIATDGFEGLRTREVAAATGINIATLHYYFPSKEALIRAVIGHAMQRFSQTLPTSGSPTEQLSVYLRNLADLLKRDQQLWAVMGELVLRAPRDPELGQIVGQMNEFWHTKLRDLIARLERPGLDADAVAALLIAAIKGLSLPTEASVRPRRIDQVFGQARHLLGLSESAPE